MGTAAVMLGASLSLFAFVGTLVSFGAWPGLGSHEQVDSLIVESVTAKTTEPLRIDVRPRRASAGEGVRDAVRQAAEAPATAGARPQTPAARVPGAPVPAPAPAPSDGDRTAPAQAPATEPVQRPLEQPATELDRAVDTVTQQAGEIVSQVGQQVQEPLTRAEPVTGGLPR